jgi:hypothetical protein
MKIKTVNNAILGIGTEIIYAASIITVAFLICLILALT